MATGAAPALEQKAETKTETSPDAGKAQPATLKERVARLLNEIFEGRDEYLGWRQ
jgi:hypothetical protein